ncbi:cytochrome P450 [Vigna unguiculata]|uniref:Cytochrome P450 n=1 Tax=Vigna unguiculata TaxID=3917 RepID=A0A4D6MNN3_VIGUN|nr:cytochrome P450 [Vigna unguiculata]
MFSSLLLILCLIFPLFLPFFFKYFTTLKSPPFPPGPRGLPIVGNLHQLEISSLHMQLWQFSKKYGSLFSLQFGLRRVIVVSSPKLAKVVMKDHDLECCDRPKLLGQQKLSYDGLDMHFPHTVAIGEKSEKSVLYMSLTPNVSHVFPQIALGKRYEEEGTERSMFHRLFSECQVMMSSFFVSEYIPFMGWDDTLRGLHARLERTFKEMDKFYQQVIEEHMADSHKKTPQEQDIVDVLLQLKKNYSFSIDITNDNIKAVLMNILTAATDATSVTVVWAMTLLLKHPRVMKKVQEEIRSLSGKKPFLDEDDVQKLPYLKAVIKEAMRLHPAVPLLLPRETREKVMIDGYEIPAKTIIYVNGWAIHRDPEAWEDAEEFIPERFLNSTVDLRGKDFCFIPFGAGRRICPGLNMAFATFDVILGNLLYSFDWELPEGMKSEDIDTETLPGVTQYKKNPLCVMAKCQM